MDFSAALYRELSKLLPSYEISIGLADGPFEDDQGTSSHFDKDALAHKQVQRQILATKVDFHASVVKLARHTAMQLPHIIIGEGQGGLIAAGFAKPGVVEAAFTTRNVQQQEVYQLAAAWGKVGVVVIRNPRMSKTGVYIDKLKHAVPELFAEHPEHTTKTILVKQKNDPLYESTKKFEQIMSLVTVMNLSDLPWNEVLTIPARLMWEHNGKCSCGRRVFLFCECKQCLTEAKSNQQFKQVQTCLLYTSDAADE